MRRGASSVGVRRLRVLRTALLLLGALWLASTLWPLLRAPAPCAEVTSTPPWQQQQSPPLPAAASAPPDGPSQPCGVAATLDQLRRVRAGEPLEFVAASRPPCAPLAPADAALPPLPPPPTLGASDVAVYDVFPFNGEVDLLEIRLRELAPVVRMFVIVECTFDERGRDKLLTFHGAAARSRWAFAAARVLYAPCGPADRAGADAGPAAGDSWRFNHAPYLAGMRALRTLRPRPGDLVITGDLDELVSAEAVAALTKLSPLATTPASVTSSNASAAVAALAQPGAFDGWLSASGMSLYHERSCFTSDWPSNPGAGDYRFPVVARYAALLAAAAGEGEERALLAARTRAYQQAGSFRAQPRVTGAHWSWRADTLLVLLKLRSNIEQSGAVDAHPLLAASATAADVAAYVAELRERKGARFRADWAQRVQDCQPAWVPAFAARNRGRFQF